MRKIVDGFFFLFRGLGESFRTKKVFWLFVVPVLINLLLFIGFAVLLWGWVAPGLAPAQAASTAVGVVAYWAGVASVFLVALFVYVFLFPMIAEVIGAPFYEAIGGKIDRAHKVEIVERTIWQEICLAISQEARKLIVILALALAVFVLQFAPVIGQLLSAGLGFCVLVVSLGADSVGPPLARRGLLLGDRRLWVVKHPLPVIGLGMAKALFLVIPFLNVLVLPVAAAGGTLLVQRYDTPRTTKH